MAVGADVVSNVLSKEKLVPAWPCLPGPACLAWPGPTLPYSAPTACRTDERPGSKRELGLGVDLRAPLAACVLVHGDGTSPRLEDIDPVGEVGEFIVRPGVGDRGVAVLGDGDVDVVVDRDGVPKPDAREVGERRGRRWWGRRRRRRLWALGAVHPWVEGGVVLGRAGLAQLAEGDLERASRVLRAGGHSVLQCTKCVVWFDFDPASVAMAAARVRDLQR